MITNNLACCYFPTTTLFLTNRESFWESLAVHLDKFLVYRVYNDPEEALRAILQKQGTRYRQHAWLSSMHEKIADDRARERERFKASTSITKVHKEIYSHERFKEISVVVVDYNMPNISGLDFVRLAREVAPNFIKIIVIATANNETAAQQACDAGLIDRVIKPNSPVFHEELNAAINELQQRYFCSLSQETVDHLATKSDCALHEAAFTKLFHEVRSNEDVFEHYLVDNQGSFLLLDLVGQFSWLVMRSGRTIEHYNQLASENGAPQTVQQALKSRRKIPFFFTQRVSEVPVAQWGDYLHPAKKLNGSKSEYYYAIVKDAGVYNIQPEKIVSYQSYLKPLLS